MREENIVHVGDVWEGMWEGISVLIEAEPHLESDPDPRPRPLKGERLQVPRALLRLEAEQGPEGLPRRQRPHRIHNVEDLSGVQEVHTKRGGVGPWRYKCGALDDAEYLISFPQPIRLLQC